MKSNRVLRAFCASLLLTLFASFAAAQAADTQTRVVTERVVITACRVGEVMSVPGREKKADAFASELAVQVLSGGFFIEPLLNLPQCLLKEETVNDPMVVVMFAAYHGTFTADTFIRTSASRSPILIGRVVLDSLEGPELDAGATDIALAALGKLK